MNKKRSRINLLLMPTNQCNMNCVYCYRRAECEPSGKMSLELLSKIYEITFKHFDEVTIIWHGGEPLIMGAEFYRQALAMQKNYLQTKIANKMQTNLTLLDDETADILSENKIGVGSSFDGLQNESLRGQSETILQNREKLIRRKMNCGFIFVVSKKNIDALIENYEFFKQRNINFSMNLYIPTRGKFNDELELEPKHAVEKILELYDYWVRDKDCNIRVNYFERMLDFIFSRRKTLCTFSSCLGKWLGIRYDGKIFPCNRAFPEKYSYGNVADYDNIADAFRSEGFRLMLLAAIERREKCKACEIFSFCEGGCNNVALNENGMTNINGTHCIILKAVFRHILNDARNLNRREVNPHVLDKILSQRQEIGGGGRINQ